MIISDFTEIELEYFRGSCNFVGYEREVFELRGKGIPLETIAEKTNMSVAGIKKISQKVNNKISKVTSGIPIRHLQ